jgi:hypothetical protein
LGSTFDLISAEYGWSDDQILDLTLARMRMIQDVILMRRQDDFLQWGRLAESHAVGIVGAMPALAHHPRSGRSIQKYVKKLRLVQRPKKLPSYDRVKKLFGG